MNLNKLIFGIIVFCFISLHRHKLLGQNDIPSHLTDLVIARYSNDLSGAAIGIYKNGNLFFEYYSGMANIEYDIPVTKRTKFPIGSVTKQFTAALILYLEQKEQLSINDYIDKYLPEFEQNDYPIRIHHLLSHTSGLPSDNKQKDLSKNLRNSLSPAEMISFIKNEPLLFTPGSRYDYSNIGYILLGLIIESVCNQPYADVLQSIIFTPLNMDQTSLSGFGDIIKNRAIGYAFDDNQYKHAIPHSQSFSAGGIVSTPTDLCKWVQGLFSEKIISQSQIEKMKRRVLLNDGSTLNHGFGWELNKISDDHSLEHSGFIPGYKCNTIYVPAEDLYVVVMQNSERGSPTKLSIHLAAQSLNKPYPNIKNQIALKRAQLDQFTGVYSRDQDQERIIEINEDALFYKAPGGKAQKIYPIDYNRLILENGYQQLRFSELYGDKFQEIQYLNRIESSYGHRISDFIPEQNVAIELSEKELEPFTGAYKSSQFIMYVTLESGSLYGQPDGSEKLKLIPKSKNQFFIQEIGAEIEFLQQKKGPCIMKILLEGNEMVGVKSVN